MTLALWIRPSAPTVSSRTTTAFSGFGGRPSKTCSRLTVRMCCARARRQSNSDCASAGRAAGGAADADGGREEEGAVAGAVGTVDGENGAEQPPSTIPAATAARRQR